MHNIIITIIITFSVLKGLYPILYNQMTKLGVLEFLNFYSEKLQIYS